LRALVALLVLLGHLLVLELFEAPALPFAAEGKGERSSTMTGRAGLRSGNAGDEAMSVIFIERPRAAAASSHRALAGPEPTPDSAADAPPIARSTQPTAAPMEAAATAAAGRVDRVPQQVESMPATGSATSDGAVDAAIASPPRLFARDGAILLPRESIEELRRADADDREFAFQWPGLAAGASGFERRDELPYEATRFDRYHPQTTDIVTGALRALADSMTFGTRSGSVRCAMLSAEGGANCTFGGGGRVVELDDPDSLDATENARCQALWDQVVAASTQDAWLALRQQYRAECRKPPAETPADPPAAPGRIAG